MNLLYVLVISVLSILYIWSLYNIAILTVGVRNLRKRNNKRITNSTPTKEELPIFSIIVPAKDEEKVVGRLLDSLLKLNYPSEKREIIVIEDGSGDNTSRICEKYARQYPDQVRFINQSKSNGKPSALNYALKHVTGSLVGVFDADNVPEPDILLKTAEYFETSSIAAVQGRPYSINADENMLSKFISYEEAVRYETYLRGKDVLKLFVPLTGSCYFVRRNVLDELGGWNETCLSEDTELSSRLIEKDYDIRYAPDVRSWQENPTSLTQLFKQRVRWFRGCMEVSLKYGRLMKKVNRRCFDAEVTLFAPFMFVPFLLGYLLGIYGFVGSLQLDLLSSLMTQGMMLLTTVTLFLIGTTLLCMTKPRKFTNLLWLPFVYAYLSIQNFVALYALAQIVLKRPRRWIKTTKTGTITNFV